MHTVQDHITNLSPESGVNIYQRMSSVARDTGAVNLAQGIPEALFDVDWQREATKGMQASWQYTPTWGMPLLRNVIARQYGLTSEDGCLVTSGCTGALAAAMLALATTGTRNIVALEPFYSYYPGIARLAGCSLIPSKLQGPIEALSIDWSDLENKLSAGPSTLLINSPHNPSGLVLTKHDWEHLTDICERLSTVMLVDDVYRAFSYTETTPLPHEFASIRSLWAGSISKTLAGTGVRIGWLVGDRDLVERAHIAHMHTSNCLPAHLQIAAATLLDELTLNAIASIRKRYALRRNRLTEALSSRGFRCAKADGGHFILATHDMHTDNDMNEYCLNFARLYGVAPLPVNGFFLESAPPWMRFSFALPDADIDLACQRILKIPKREFVCQ